MAKPTTTKRARLGQMAVATGQINVAKLEECLGLQTLRRRGGAEIKIGEVMIERGYLTHVQVELLLEVQGGAKMHMEVGGFEILDKLGRGGMSSVYKARDLVTGRIVALKVMPPKVAADMAMLERFRRESRAAMLLDHPNVVKGITAGEDGGFYFFAMEYVRGRSLLRTLERQGPLEERRAVGIARQVAAALDYAAGFGLLHRDIKPDNILVLPDDFTKVTDFGLSRFQGGDDTSLTLPGMAIGTPYYMSPEQARGEIDIDIRSDLYSLGVTLYEMLTGAPPYQGPSVALILARHLTEKPRPLHDHKPLLTDAICAIVARLLQKGRAQRHDTPAELLTDLDELAAQLAKQKRP